MKHIEKKDFEREVVALMRKSVSDDYVGNILRQETQNGQTVLDLIREDVEETSAWEDEGYYNEDDIKLAIGRVLKQFLEGLA